MLRICPLCDVPDSGGVLVPLRGGSSENALPKDRKNDGRHLRHCLDGVFAKKKQYFSGSDTRARTCTIHATLEIYTLLRVVLSQGKLCICIFYAFIV